MEQATDRIREHMLDGNAAAGLLHEFFGEEMTVALSECQNCGREGELGGLLAFAPEMGFVLRCPACEHVVLRIVKTPHYVYLDLRGAAYVRVTRAAA